MTPPDGESPVRSRQALAIHLAGVVMGTVMVIAAALFVVPEFGVFGWVWGGVAVIVLLSALYRVWLFLRSSAPPR